MIQTIPFKPNVPDQKFKITIKGVVYKFRLIWTETLGFWSLSVSDILNNPIISGKMLAGGVDLTSQYNLPISKMYMINIDDNKQEASESDINTGSFLIIEV